MPEVDPKASTARAKLIEIEQFEASYIGQALKAEIERRAKNAQSRACDLDLPGKKRAGGAGAARELEQLLEFIPQLKRELSSQLKK